ncbi:MAG: ATPase, T2SS/T4P/T4SS family [Isosphaeraceae bacterium]
MSWRRPGRQRPATSIFTPVTMGWKFAGGSTACSSRSRCFPHDWRPMWWARLKVLAELLTYRTDVPQEGRIRGAPGEVEMRLSTFPTLHGEKAVVRLFAGSGRFLRLADLGLPAEVHDALSQVLDETSGAGPS